MLTKVNGSHVLHVIDGTRDKDNDKPSKVTLTLNADRLGGINNAFMIETLENLKLERKGNLVTFTVHPDPVASIELK